MTDPADSRVTPAPGGPETQEMEDLQQIANDLSRLVGDHALDGVLGHEVHAVLCAGLRATWRAQRAEAALASRGSARPAATPNEIRLEMLRSAFIQGMDLCRQHYQGYGEWPTLPGRVEMAQDQFPDQGAGDTEPDTPQPKRERHEVRFDDPAKPEGTIDEVVGYGRYHLEMMNDDYLWLRLGPDAFGVRPAKRTRTTRLHFTRTEEGTRAEPGEGARTPETE